jgi:hypothetical protein
MTSSGRLYLLVNDDPPYIDAKSSDIPAAWVGRFAEFTTRIGYRFALASAPEIPASVAGESAASITLTWANAGNAPVCRPYRLAVRLISGGVETARAVSGADV